MPCAGMQKTVVGGTGGEGEYTYIIDKVNGNTRVSDQNGVQQTINADARVSIQWAYNNLDVDADGKYTGKIFIKRGTYDVSSGAITFPSESRGILTEGEKGTILRGEQNVASVRDIYQITNLISLDHAGLVFRNIKFLYGRSAIHLYRVRQASIESCWFKNQMKYGIWLQLNADDFNIDNCYFEIDDTAFSWGVYTAIYIHNNRNNASIGGGVIKTIGVYMHSNPTAITDFRSIHFYHEGLTGGNDHSENILIMGWKHYVPYNRPNIGILFSSDNIEGDGATGKSITVINPMVEQDYVGAPAFKIKDCWLTNLDVQGGTFFNSIVLDLSESGGGSYRLWYPILDGGIGGWKYVYNGVAPADKGKVHVFADLSRAVACTNDYVPHGVGNDNPEQYQVHYYDIREGWKGRPSRLESGRAFGASQQVRGLMMVNEGGIGVADTLVICLKDAADSYNWVTIV